MPVEMSTNRRRNSFWPIGSISHRSLRMEWNAVSKGTRNGLWGGIESWPESTDRVVKPGSEFRIDHRAKRAQRVIFRPLRRRVDRAGRGIRLNPGFAHLAFCGPRCVTAVVVIRRPINSLLELKSGSGEHMLGECFRAGELRMHTTVHRVQISIGAHIGMIPAYFAEDVWRC